MRSKDNIPTRLWLIKILSSQIHSKMNIQMITWKPHQHNELRWEPIPQRWLKTSKTNLELQDLLAMGTDWGRPPDHQQSLLQTCFQCHKCLKRLKYDNVLFTIQVCYRKNITSILIVIWNLQTYHQKLLFPSCTQKNSSICLPCLLPAPWQDPSKRDWKKLRKLLLWK